MDLNFIILCFWFLLSGIEYAIILPSINEFLEQLDSNEESEKSYLGFALSAFSLTGLIFSPIYGRITDKTNSVKLTIVFSNLFEIGGNFMYMAADNALMVVVSRLVAGIGSGSGSSIFGSVSKTTGQKERTSKLAQLMSVRQLGLIVGPAFNFLLGKLNFNMGSVHINNLSGAGFFMAVIWSLYTIGIMIFYKEGKEVNGGNGNNEETEVLISEDHSSYGATSKNFEQQNEVQPADLQSWSRIKKDLFREEVIVCLAANFFIMFIQTGFETVITPFSAQYFGWDSMANSLFFLGGAIDVLIAFFIMAKLSKVISDRLMILGGYTACFILLAIYIPYVYYAQFAKEGSTWLLVCFILHAAVFIFSLPFLFTPSVSLFSKITNAETQSFNQGIRISVRGLGQIIGPLWAASLTGSRLPYMVAVDVLTCGVVLFMIILSYDKLKEQSSEETSEVVNA